ncbi:unnamed protein product [Caenorhabditis angaria]|uniref:Uncharacterized protein n=1 Tax=Caenorhabditis angaria TaxID=860376 RepID=A0A9P1NA97_9PELO|nr:unnamed protein product [Caenorhabditis angaria]
MFYKAGQLWNYRFQRKIRVLSKKWTKTILNVRRTIIYWLNLKQLFFITGCFTQKSMENGFWLEVSMDNWISMAITWKTWKISDFARI